MSSNNLFLQPPLDVQVRPMKLSSSLKQAGMNTLSHKGPTPSLFSSQEDDSINISHHSKEIKSILSPTSSYTESRKRDNLDISSNNVKLQNYSIIESPHFFLKHETKSEPKLHRKFDLPKHISPAPLLINEYWQNDPSELKPKYISAISPEPLSCRNRYLHRLEKPRQESSNRKMVVIDLDETLIHASPMNKKPDHIITKILPDGSSMCLKVSIRPYAKEFLRIVSSLAETAIFTASVKNYADSIIELLDPNREYINKRFYRDSCTVTKQGFVKDLSILKKPLKDLLIIDNLASSFAKQKENGILISSWFGDKKDNELYKLSKNIHKILAYDDLRKSDKNFQVIY